MSVKDRTKRLRQLNQQSEEMKTRDKEIPWLVPVRNDQFWIAESLTHLYHLPVYQNFSTAEKLAYNHAFALMVVEQSVLFEELICSFIRKIFLKSPAIREKLESEFNLGLDHFLREESEHTEIFWKLAHVSDPGYGAKRVYRYYKPKLLDFVSTKVLLSFPGVAALWTWLSLYGEEKFLLNYREIRKSDANPLTRIDPVHEAVHYFHMVDEARHVQMDEFFVEECWDRASPALRWINRLLLGRIYRSFVVNTNSGWALWKLLVTKHPGLKGYSREVKKQLKELGRTRSYQQIMCDRSSIPRTSSLFDSRPEFHSFSKVLPGYSPRV